MDEETKHPTKDSEAVAHQRIVSDLGHDFMDGVLTQFEKRFTKWMIIGVIVIAVINFTRNHFGFGLDNSDTDGNHRSGLQVHTDAKTGIEYLSDGKGGLVRREYR